MTKSLAGFSMVELIVSISILVLVLSIVLTQQSSFNSAVLLRSQAYEVALAMREVQLSAVSASNDNAGNFRTIQGVHFNTSGIANNDKYTVFLDNGNNFYRSADTDDTGYEYLLDRRFQIVGYSETVSGGTLSVVFQRPNFDAEFYQDANDRINVPSIRIMIGLRGLDSSERTCGEHVREIEVTAAGQIAVLECP